jgi:ubiquitin C-terminal hydrolase
MIGVKNKGNTCYISAALQLLKKIFPYVFTEVQDKFSFEMSKFISL